MHKKCLCSIFFHIARHAWENQEELKFSDNDVRKIAALKIETKKLMIKNEAETETIALDIMAGLWAENPDAAALNKLIDKKIDLKQEGAKKFIQAFVDLKKMFSREQLAKLKEICMRQECGKEAKCEGSCGKEAGCC
ncbi:MAG: hypothetical protein PHP17_02215 [Candidatus Omnitrophica bacterium]|nr:hypothetical protein [Candidatus Omnitrophota bacterium]